MLTFKSVFLATILLKLLHLSESYIITIDARAQDCFFEKGPKMSKNDYNRNSDWFVQCTNCFAFYLKLGLMFEVIDGGFNDIELRITDPEGKVIHEGEEKSGKYIFGSGDPEAKYTYCFINEKGSMAPKTIMFNMDVLSGDRAPGAPNEGEVGHNKLEDMVNYPKNATYIAFFQ